MAHGLEGFERPRLLPGASGNEDRREPEPARTAQESYDP